jgi:hypothetical protein
MDVSKLSTSRVYVLEKKASTVYTDFVCLYKWQNLVPGSGTYSTQVIHVLSEQNTVEHRLLREIYRYL